jgi:hypothetical protein
MEKSYKQLADILVGRTCPSFKTTFGSVSPTFTSGTVDEDDMFNVDCEIGDAIFETNARLDLAALC